MRSGHQSKWGRHRCRPHSHRRVGAFCWTSHRQAGLPPHPRHAWRPMSMPFAERSDDAGPRARLSGVPVKARLPRLASSPALAPASGIRLGKGSTPPLSRGFARALRLFRAKPRLFACAVCELQWSLVVFTTSALDREPGSQSFTLPVLRACLRRSALLGVKTLGMTFLEKHVDSCQRSLIYLKCFRFSALRRCLGGVSGSKDSLKMRSNPAFDKGCKSELSTFPRIFCGHLWTSQHLAALPSIYRARPIENRFSRDHL